MKGDGKSPVELYNRYALAQFFLGTGFNILCSAIEGSAWAKRFAILPVLLYHFCMMWTGIFWKDKGVYSDSYGVFWIEFLYTAFSLIVYFLARDRLKPLSSISPFKIGK